MTDSRRIECASPKRHDGHIRTVTGQRVNLLNPDPNTIQPFDIAHHLSNLCRFVGGTITFYSVAQHSVLASLLVPEPDALWALLHDASEAYLGDVSRPLKHGGALEGYKAAERRMMEAVVLRFGLGYDEPASVTQADEVLLATEQRDVRPPRNYVPDNPDVRPLAGRIRTWTPEESRAAFLERLEQLGVYWEVPDWARGLTKPPRLNELLFYAARLAAPPAAPPDAYIG